MTEFSTLFLYLSCACLFSVCSCEHGDDPSSVKEETEKIRQHEAAVDTPRSRCRPAARF